jgi:hypothetical protein
MGVRDRIAKVVRDRIRAFHSSPHDFDKFRLDKMGTGEGAQVYGPGIYAAENPKVSGRGGEYWQNFLERFSGPELDAAETLRLHDFDRAKAAAAVRRQIELNEKWLDEPSPSHLGAVGKSVFEEGRRESVARLNAMRRRELDLLESGKPVGPRTYEVDIHGRPEQFLDYDKPFAQQSESVQRSLRSLSDYFKPPSIFDPFKKYRFRPEEPGSSFVPREPGMLPQYTEAGIPGIRYLDAGSRGLSPARAALQPPTSNYVIFDPDKIDIVKKYAVPGALAPMGALAAQDQYRTPELEQPVSP